MLTADGYIRHNLLDVAIQRERNPFRKSLRTCQVSRRLIKMGYT